MRIYENNFNVETGELETPWGVFQNGPMLPISVGYAQCKYFRDYEGNKTQKLADDIKAYEYVLNHPDAEKLANAYGDWREETHENGFKTPIRIYAKKMGWFDD